MLNRAPTVGLRDRNAYLYDANVLNERLESAKLIVGIEVTAGLLDGLRGCDELDIIQRPRDDVNWNPRDTSFYEGRK